MSQSAYRAAIPRRRRWPLFLPFGIVVLLAIAWSGLWFYAAARAEAEIAAWRAREQQAGRSQDCASQSISGYPFRIEVRCSAASFQLRGTPSLQLKLPFILAAAQIYDPKLLISEFTGPLEISEPGRPPSYVVNWALGQASVRGLPSEVERVSLVLDAPSVRDAAANDTVFKAQRVELHGRQAAGSVAGNPVIETVLRLSGAVADKLHPLAAKPIDADIAAVLHGATDISPKPWPVRFREWQAHDGRLEVIKARVQQDDVIAVGAGTLKLTFDIERIMSEGQIGATLSALDRIIPGLGGIARANTPGLVSALGQRTTLDGKPAVAFPVRFNDGTVFLGPFQVGQIAPLF